MKTDENMKRSSLRFNLHREKDRKAWEALAVYEQFGYASRQDFIRDALIAYHGWLRGGSIPYTRKELEAEMKRWMREVLTQCTLPVLKEEPLPEKTDKKEPEEGLIDNSILAMANDFLSTL